MTRLLDRFDHFLIDLDGVVYLGDQLTPCAAETFTALNEAGKRLRFITNDPRQTANDYAKKLTRLGIPAEPPEFLSGPLRLHVGGDGRTEPDPSRLHH